MGAEHYINELYPISLENPEVKMEIVSVTNSKIATVEDAAQHALANDPRPPARYNDLLVLIQGEDHEQINMVQKEGMRFLFCGDTVVIGNPQTKETTGRFSALIYVAGRLKEIVVNLTEPWNPERDRIVVLETKESSLDRKR